ncbi:C-type mannose receptor 2-like [Ylistrum balloti]|uniref:C-type mannose receptor 2-like n=1 Tax=Ylistrum balloti TaxID=509963 RepID=UPI002905F1A2|nr:C-type mannose receptor 2-like [Ylistrum balloti]
MADTHAEMRMKYVSLAFYLVLSATNGYKCPVGNWIQIQGNCYLFSSDGLTWDQATTDCRQFGATLLQFNGAADRKLFTLSIANMTSERWWTNLNDYNHPGGWSWGKDDSETLADPTAVVWNVEPDDRHHIENCGALNIQGTLSDQKCSERHGYICEYNPRGSGCPLHWIVTTTNCYYVSDLTDEYNIVTWSDASNICKTQHPGSNANLLRLETANEQAYIRAQLAEIQMTDQLYWVGMTDQAKEGTWTWDDGSPVNQSNIEWTVEPNNLGGTEQCALIYDNGRFADADCSRLEKYICQTPRIDDSKYTNKMGCPNGWVRAGHKCYYFHIQRPQNHMTAASTCVEMGGRLIQIETKDEEDWLRVQTLRYDSYAFWTGLMYQPSSGTWIWNMDTKANMSLVIWNQEPNNMGNEDCGMIANDGIFNDLSCYANQGFICEAQTEDQPCPNGWITRTAGDMLTCYLISNITDADMTTWQGARDKCAQISEPLDGYLLAINTKDEAAFIANALKNTSVTLTGWWTGLNDRKVEGYWEYDTAFNNPVKKNVIPWGGEPDNSGGTDYCTVLYSGRYNDVNCNNVAFYLCEKMAAGLQYTSAGSSLHSGVFMMLPFLYSLLNNFGFI